MLKKWILAAALAVLPFAATAELKTTQAQDQVFEASDVNKMLLSLSPTEKARIRQLMVGAMKEKALQQKPDGCCDVELHNDDTIVYSFLYFEDMYKEIEERTRKVEKNKPAAVLAAMEKMISLFHMCWHRTSEAAEILQSIGITHFRVRIVDDNKKVLAEAPRRLMPDCTAK